MTTNEPAAQTPEYDPVKVLEQQSKDRPPGVPVVKIPRPVWKPALGVPHG